MDIIGVVSSNLLGATGVAIVAFLGNKYLDQLTEQIKEYKVQSTAITTDLASRITSGEAKYRDILDIVLDKFSKWEDRISGLLAKMGSISPEEMQKDIEKFRAEAASDLLTMKLKVARVSSDVQSMKKAAVEKTVVESEIKVVTEIDEANKKLILDRLEDTKGKLESRVKFMEDNFTKVIKMLNVINQKQKEHDFKIENLTVTRKLP